LCVCIYVLLSVLVCVCMCLCACIYDTCARTAHCALCFKFQVNMYSCDHHVIACGDNVVNNKK
jgi:hypothetical protein